MVFLFILIVSNSCHRLSLSKLDRLPFLCLILLFISGVTHDTKVQFRSCVNAASMPLNRMCCEKFMENQILQTKLQSRHRHEKSKAKQSKTWLNLESPRHTPMYTSMIDKTTIRSEPVQLTQSAWTWPGCLHL